MLWIVVDGKCAPSEGAVLAKTVRENFAKEALSSVSAVAAVARSEGHVPGHGPRSRHAKAARNTPHTRDNGYR